MVFMAVIAFAFMSPVIEGKQISQYDIQSARNMAFEAEQFQNETGEYSAWTNSSFGGMPTYQIKSPPSGNIFKSVFRIFKFWMPGYSVAILFICLLGFYTLLRILKLNRWLAFAGAIAFAMGSHHLQLIGAGHVSKIYAVGYLAPVIAGMLLVFRKNYIWGGLLTAVGLGIQLSTNHVQVTYYLGMMILVYLLVELVFAIREKYFGHMVKAGLTLFAALILAVIPNMTLILTTAEYTQETTRGKNVLAEAREIGTQDPDLKRGKSGLDLDYITAWSYGIGETMNLFIPNLYGGGSATDLGPKSQFYEELRKRGNTNARELVKRSPTYWASASGTAGPHYVGAVTVFLAILGLFLVRGPRKWWLLLIIILSFALAWGRNFMALTEFFVNNVPLYAKFRDVTNTLIIAQFALPLLAFLGIKEWFDNQTEPASLLRKLYYATGIAGGIALLYLAIPSLAGSFVSPGDSNYQETWVGAALQADRITLARNDAFRTLVFVLLAATLLFVSIKTRVKREYLFIALALLVMADLFSAGKRYLNEEDFVSKRVAQAETTPRPADQAVLKDQHISYRVLDLSANPFTSATASRFHKSLGGYHGAKLGRFQDVTERHFFGEIQELNESLQNPSIDRINLALAGMNCFNMLNTKYIIVSPTMGPLLNETALGNAWFVEEIITVPDAGEEMVLLGSFNPARSALVHKEFEIEIEPLLKPVIHDSIPDQIRLEEYKPNYLKYSAQTSEPRLAVFSEIWYPHGWKASLNGEVTDYIRANYLLRAMVIPAGTHTVEFSFDPESLKTGFKVSLAGSFLLVILALGALFAEWRKRG